MCIYYYMENINCGLVRERLLEMKLKLGYFPSKGKKKEGGKVNG